MISHAEKERMDSRYMEYLTHGRNVSWLAGYETCIKDITNDEDFKDTAIQKELWTALDNAGYNVVTFNKNTLGVWDVTFEDVRQVIRHLDERHPNYHLGMRTIDAGVYNLYIVLK